MNEISFFVDVVPVRWIDLWNAILPVAGFVLGGYLRSWTWK